MHRWIPGLLLVSLSTCAVSDLNAAIVFENFNTNEGRFNTAPNFSSSFSTNVTAASTADRVVSPNPVFEGTGSERIVLDLAQPGASTTLSRVRFLANSGAPGTPINPTFNLSNAVDGFIGYYLLSPISNTSTWTATIALDGPTNVTGEISEGVPLNIVNDGLWHLYEWNLDDASKWRVVSGIGGNAALENGAASIDSVILRSTGFASNSTFYMDFVAKSDSGSIASLVTAVPEPGSMLTFALAGAATLVYRRKGLWRKDRR
jgi:hypothetical protein